MIRPNNGGGTPPEDGGAHPGDLPEFPPEWGTVVIPDNAAELEEEAAALRRELRRDHRRERVRTAFGVGQPTREGQPLSLGVPVVIMAVAVLTTLASLFIVTWGRQPSPPVPVATPPSKVAQVTAPTPVLADLVLPDSSGEPVRVGDLLPAVILLADGCNCTPLVSDVSAVAPAGVTVVPVGRTAPCTAGGPANVRCLADPDGQLRSRYAGNAGTDPASATAVLVARSGLVASTISGVTSADELVAGLRRLTE